MHPATGKALLAAAVLGLAALSCGKRGKDGPAPQTPPASGTKASAEPAPEDGPHPAKVAFDAFLALGDGADAGDRLAALARGYRAFLRSDALWIRDELVTMVGVGNIMDFRRRYDDIIRSRKNRGEEVEEIRGQPSAEFMQTFLKQSEEKAGALFGLSCSDLKERDDDGAFALWIEKNWATKVRPSVEGAVPAGERDFFDRVLLFFEAGRGLKNEFAMELEEGTYRYAGRREERAKYVRGPRRATLFDLSSESQRREAAETDLSELQSGLMFFKQHMERWPAGIEGLEVLLQNPGGGEGQKWLGPYIRHIYDPWGRRYRLQVPGENNPEYYDIWSAGPDGLDGTSDDVKNW